MFLLVHRRLANKRYDQKQQRLESKINSSQTTSSIAFWPYTYYLMTFSYDLYTHLDHITKICLAIMAPWNSSLYIYTKIEPCFTDLGYTYPCMYSSHHAYKHSHYPIGHWSPHYRVQDCKLKDESDVGGTYIMFLRKMKKGLHNITTKYKKKSYRTYHCRAKLGILCWSSSQQVQYRHLTK